MFGNPSWLHFGLALRDIRHKEARSQTPFIGEKSAKNQLGSHVIVKNDAGVSYSSVLSIYDSIYDSIYGGAEPKSAKISSEVIYLSGK